MGRGDPKSFILGVRKETKGRDFYEIGRRGGRIYYDKVGNKKL